MSVLIKLALRVSSLGLMTAAATATASLAATIPKSSIASRAGTKAPPTCSTGQLHIRVESLVGAAGTEHAILRFTNSAAECSMIGYPGFVPLTAAGHRAKIHLLRGPVSGASTSSTIQRVNLGREKSAWADVYWPDQCSQGALRPTKTIVTPPNDYRSAQILAKPLLGSGKVVICGTRLEISPVFAKLKNPPQA